MVKIHSKFLQGLLVSKFRKTISSIQVDITVIFAVSVVDLDRTMLCHCGEGVKSC